MDKEVISLIEEDEFYKQQGPGVILFLSMAGLSGFLMKEKLGYGYKHFLYSASKDVAEIFYSLDGLKRINKIVCEKLENDKDYLSKVRKIHNDHFKSLSKEFFSKKKDFARDYTDDELKGIFLLGMDLLAISVGEGHIIEPFVIMHDHLIREKLRAFVKDNKELNQVLNVLTTPTEKSFAARYQDGLKEISKVKDNLKRRDMLNKHIEKYYWVRNSYCGASPIKIKDLEQELLSLKKSMVISDNIKLEKEELIMKYSIDKETVELCNQLVYLTDWQDERKEKILRSIGENHIIVSEFARRAGIPFSLFGYCTIQEIIKGVKKEILQELKERKKFCILYQGESEEMVFTGKSAKEIYKVLTRNKGEDKKTINGVCASLGKAIGKVSICTSLKDINKFKEGRVLVTSMTRPEFLPAMKKAVAIVTDEGGITCHAAIVSRELGIPCVIGTKNATKILKDDDLVEVSANHGAVKILR